MDYRDRAVSVVQAAEKNLRAQLRPIILEAIAADAYVDVAAIARIAGALSELLRQVTSDTYEVNSIPRASLEDLLGSERTPPPAPGEHTAALSRLPPRPNSRREQYPQFLRDGDRLLKIAWSKKDRAPYEHRAPRSVIQALIAAVQKKKGEGKLFQAADVMPIKNAQHEEYPSYQSYLALNWLREAGLIVKKGRNGYVLKPKASAAERLERLWNSLPTLEPTE